VNNRLLECVLLLVHKISPILFSWNPVRKYFTFLWCGTVKLHCQKFMYIAVLMDWWGRRGGDENVCCWATWGVHTWL